jgi:hypothetical protein
MIIIGLTLLLVSFIAFYIVTGYLEFLQTKKLPLFPIMTGLTSLSNNYNKDYIQKDEYSKEPSQKSTQTLGNTNPAKITEDTQNKKNCGDTRYCGEYIYDIPFSHIVTIVLYLVRIIKRLKAHVNHDQTEPFINRYVSR